MRLQEAVFADEVFALGVRLENRRNLFCGRLLVGAEGFDGRIRDMDGDPRINLERFESVQADQVCACLAPSFSTNDLSFL